MTVKKDMTAAQMKVLFLDHVQEHSDSVALYTDGSKSAEGTGCASVQPAKKRAKLNNNSSVFTAELHAILELMEDIEDHAGRKYTVFTDSQSAIKAINSYGRFHPLIHKIQKWLVQIATRRKSVKFCWVPCHIGVRGNEEADRGSQSAGNRSTRTAPQRLLPSGEKAPI